MRYFLTLSYRGTHYCGWQVQPNGPAIQAILEGAWRTILRQPVEITGCGRTDAGVHARYYVAHLDVEGELPSAILHRLNSLLPVDVAIHTIQPVHAEAHARFDATERSYAYHLGLRKNPFATETAWYFSQHRLLELEKLQKVADLLPRYAAFAPFCKTNSGVENYACEVRSAHWMYETDQQQLVFHISANRFLRGMVRLIVGACLQVGLGQLSLAEVETALENQQPLTRNRSVPPQGLFLVNVKYPYPVADDMPVTLFQ